MAANDHSTKYHFEANLESRNVEKCGTKFDLSPDYSSLKEHRQHLTCYSVQFCFHKDFSRGEVQVYASVVNYSSLGGD